MNGGAADLNMHVHYADDEVWHIIEGTLTYKLKDGLCKAHKGTTAFVPAGTSYTYIADDSPCYLIILTERPNKLTIELLAIPIDRHKEIMRKY